jgi:hypothetical protein
MEEDLLVWGGRLEGFVQCLFRLLALDANKFTTNLIVLSNMGDGFPLGQGLNCYLLFSDEPLGVG